MRNDIGQLADLVAGVDAHAQRAVDAAGDPDVVRIGRLVPSDDAEAQQAEGRCVF